MTTVPTYCVEVGFASYSNEDNHIIGIEEVYSFIKKDPMLILPEAILNKLAPFLFDFALSEKKELTIDFNVTDNPDLKVFVFIRKTCPVSVN